MKIFFLIKWEARSFESEPVKCLKAAEENGKSLEQLLGKRESQLKIIKEIGEVSVTAQLTNSKSKSFIKKCFV